MLRPLAQVMCKQGWKGALEAGQSFDPALSSGKKAELTVTMLGAPGLYADCFFGGRWGGGEVGEGWEWG